MEQISRLTSDTVSFPWLGITLEINKTAFTVFGIEIKWYGIMIALGMLLAMIYCFKRTKEYGIDGDRLIDAVFAGVVGAVIGARLYYVVLHPESFRDIKEIFAIRDGGLAIYGGIIGALLFGGITAKIRKLKLPPVLDIASMGFFIGQGVGRWGNFFNQEAFGVNTTLPWGMTGGRIQSYLAYYQADLAAKGMNVDPYQPVHPCFLYESLWCLAGFLIVHFFHKKRKFDGEVFCFYVFWYGLGRAFIEGLRTDSLYIGSLRASQMLALLSCIGALAVIIIMRTKVKKAGKVTLYRDSEESKAILAEAEKAEAEEAERRKKKKNPQLTEDQKIISDEDEDEQE